MNIYLYSIYDTKAQSYSNVWQAPNNVVALRTISREVNRADEGNSLYTHSGDFELWQVAEFNTDNGTVTPGLVKLANLTTVKKENDNGRD